MWLRCHSDKYVNNPPYKTSSSLSFPSSFSFFYCVVPKSFQSTKTLRIILAPFVEHAYELPHLPDNHQFHHLRIFVCSVHPKIAVAWTFSRLFSKPSQRRISKTCTSMHYMLVFKQHRYTNSALQNIYPRTPREDVLNGLNIVTYFKMSSLAQILSTSIPYSESIYHELSCAAYTALICPLFGTHTLLLDKGDHGYCVVESLLSIPIPSWPYSLSQSTRLMHTLNKPFNIKWFISFKQKLADRFSTQFRQRRRR